MAPLDHVFNKIEQKNQQHNSEKQTKEREEAVRAQAAKDEIRTVILPVISEITNELNRRGISAEYSLDLDFFDTHYKKATPKISMIFYVSKTPGAKYRYQGFLKYELGYDGMMSAREIRRVPGTSGSKHDVVKYLQGGKREVGTCTQNSVRINTEHLIEDTFDLVNGIRN